MTTATLIALLALLLLMAFAYYRNDEAHESEESRLKGVIRGLAAQVKENQKRIDDLHALSIAGGCTEQLTGPRLADLLGVNQNWRNQ